MSDDGVNGEAVKQGNGNGLVVGLRLAIWVIAALSVAVVVLSLPSLPQTIVTHYGPHGVPDGWGGRFSLVWTSLESNVGFAVLWLGMEFLVRLAYRKGWPGVQDRSLQLSLMLLLGSGVVVELGFLALNCHFIHSVSGGMRAEDIGRVAYPLVGVVLGIVSVATGAVMMAVRRSAIFHVPGVPVGGEAGRSLQHHGAMVFIAVGVVMVGSSAILRGMWVLVALLVEAVAETVAFIVVSVMARKSAAADRLSR